MHANLGTSVAAIAALLKEADSREFAALEEALAGDPRKGVQKALEMCRKRLAAQAVEAERLAALYGFDRQFAQSGPVVGLDEVGRGAIAGPLAVGAVVLPANAEPIAMLNDSKQLTPQQREDVAARIKDKAVAWKVYFVEPQVIDAKGMAAALRMAFRGALDAIESVGVAPGTVLVDGNPLSIDPREVNVIKGDATSASIAAASIVAKVERDHLMAELDSTYPQYGFSSHKGYGSKDHGQAIREFGLCPIHRATFCESFTQPTLF